jgi:penicillin-binding protein 1B
MRSAKKPSKGLRIRVNAFWRRRWVRVSAVLLGIPALLLCIVAAYYYVIFARLIDNHLAGERQRVLPRVFARPLELRRGQSLTEPQLVDRLNDLGYTQRPVVEKPGEFTVAAGSVTLMARSPELSGKLARVVFQKPPAPGRRTAKPPQKVPDRVERLELSGQAHERLMLDAPLLSSMVAQREKRRPVALSAIPPRVVEAVLAIEDRRYYYHPGVDPIRLAGAVFQKAIGARERIQATSTITQQLIRNVFLPQFEGWSLQAAREREGLQGSARKMFELFLAFVLDTRASKDEILEMYLNEMPLGQRGSFAIHGVAEAARLFFGKDVSNVTLAEAATMAGVLQSPSALSPFNNAKRSRERRNVVLQAMVDAGYVQENVASAAAAEPLAVVQRALEAEAPYFVDYVTRTLDETYPGLTTTTHKAVDVYTTLDLHLQRVAQDAVREGLLNIDKALARRKRQGRAEAALIALNPKNGEVLAMVGGRSYNQSQYNRALTSKRQPGSVFKPFVYLSAFERAFDEGRADITPATMVDDSPTTWEFDDQVWTPQNYENEYDGPITLRRALALSRNIATIKVAEQAGYDRVAALWKRIGVGTQPRAFPSIALGVFEAAPAEIAAAYTIFPNLGRLQPISNILTVIDDGKNVTKTATARARVITRPETTFLVTNMLRHVINEGTGAGVRASFTLDAAGKTGTTNDLRDAWFVGFTPELLTVVWVGFDDNQVLGLSGAQAALPIWTAFMTRALAGTPSVTFTTPPGITFVEIDPLNGQLGTLTCPKVVREAFIAGTEPVEACELHRIE